MPSDPGTPSIPAEDLPAHLERLRREGCLVAVVTGPGLELSARILNLDAPARRVRLHIPEVLPGTLATGTPVRLALPLEGHRWEAPARVMGSPAPREFELSLPWPAEPRDRRASPRIPVAIDSGLRALVHLGPQGPALTGPLLDVSSGGFRFAVERAFDLQTRERLDPARLGLETGLALDGVELTGLRETSLEAGGLLRDLDPGPILHIQFRALLRSDRAFLQAWCDARQHHLTMPTRPELPTEPQRPPVLLWMPEGPARDALADLLTEAGQGPIACVELLPELRRSLQTVRHRAALLLGPSEELPSALALVRALRGSRPCPVHAPAPGLPGCDHLLPTPLRSSDLLAALERLG